jgi:hypothetical protein
MQREVGRDKVDLRKLENEKKKTNKGAEKW